MQLNNLPNDGSSSVEHSVAAMIYAFINSFNPGIHMYFVCSQK